MTQSLYPSSLFFAIVLLVLVAVFTTAIKGDSEVTDFDSFILRYNRSYVKGSEEYNSRRQIFQDNVDHHKLLNKRRDWPESAVYGVNIFSDLTQKEFIERHTMTFGDTPDGAQCGLQIPICKTNDDAPPLPDYWDWRNMGVVTAVKNQKQCGSCWAFAAVETVESHWAIRHHYLYDLSEQQVLDCTPHCSCKGGSSIAAYQWMMQNHGELVTSSKYAYAAKQKTCKRHGSGTPVEVSSYACCRITPKEEFTQLRAVLHQHGPFAITINGLGLKDYVGGVVQHHCGAHSQEYHGVVVVGYDIRGQIPQWIVRNSWGASFGEKGYFRLEMGKNMCGMGQFITYPTVA